MYFPTQFIEMMRERIRVSDVVGQTVKLQHKGNHYLGLCPFHKEKTPSFTVSDIKHNYYCFGCHATGDIFKFVMHNKGYDFPETVTSLANQFGIEIPKEENEDRKTTEEKFSRLYKINDLACNWFKDKLSSTSGIAAMQYLKDRGLEDSIIKKFSLGYSPGGQHSLQKYLASQNIAIEEMIEVGLLSNNQGRIHERFQGRVMFPIYNYRNKIVGFGGRIIIPHPTSPKYLNSPETILFKKGQCLYAENIVFNEHRNKDIVVVEGYMDVIGLHNVGITNVVATLGTAITTDHIEKIWRYCSNPIICLDGDSAGTRAMHRAAKLVLPVLKPGHSLQFTQLPKDHDPEEAVKAFGVQYLQNLFLKPQSLSQILWQGEFNTLQNKSPEQIALLQEKLNQLAKEITHSTISYYYKREFGNLLWDKLHRKKSKSYSKPALSDHDLSPLRNLTTGQRCELAILGLIITYPQLLRNSNVYHSVIMIKTALDMPIDIYSVIEQLWSNLTQFDDVDMMREEFQASLKEKIPLSQFDFVCGTGSYFIDKISNKDENMLLHLWEETFNNYTLELLKAEYRSIVSSGDERSLQLAINLREQIVQIEKNSLKIDN